MKIDFKNIQISQRDKRALIFAILVCLAMIAYLLLEPAMKKWNSSRLELNNKIEKIETLASTSGQAKIKGLFSVVPVFDSPSVKKEQILKFSNKFNEQIKSSGIAPSSIQLIGADKKSSKVLKLQCKADCNVDQIFTLLGSLNKNPHYAYIEEFSMKLDSKDRNKAKMSIIITTYLQ